MSSSLQPLHQELADLVGRHLAVGALLDHGLDPVDDRLERLHRDRPLLAGLEQALHHLLAVEALAPAVLLDHEVRDLVDALVGGEALAAVEALAAAADDVAFLALARVDDLVLEVGAERALHGRTSCELLFVAGSTSATPAEAEALAPEEREAEHEDGQVREGVGGDAGRGGGRAVDAEDLAEREQVEGVEAADHARRRDRDAHHQEGDQQERGVEGQVDPEGEVVEVEAERDQQPDRERLRPICARCGSGARSTASPSEKACSMRPSGSASQRGARASSRSSEARPRGRRWRGARAGRRARRGRRRPWPRPRASAAPMSRPSTCAAGVGQDEEVEREEREHGDEVDEPLEDDRGEARPRSGSGGAARRARAAAARPRAGRGGPRRSRPSWRRRGRRSRTRPSGSEQVAPAPRPRRVDGDGDERRHRRGGARRASRSALPEGAPVHPPEEEAEQGEGEEGPDEEPAPLALHRLSALLTKPFRSNT